VAMWLPHSGEVLEEPLEPRFKEAVLGRLADLPATPVEPRLAATVMVIREDPVQVFMLQRASTMAFMPNVVVFPGGRVDPGDADPDLAWAGPSPAEWARRMGLDEATARMIVVAAAREVFEESGILLAGPDESSVVRTEDLATWAEDRSRLDKHEETFASVLRRHDLVLRTDLLGLRSRWLTPEMEPRRYDTFFFAAIVPPGQAPDSETTEAVGGVWFEPAKLMAAGEAGDVLLVTPTRYNLAFLANAASGEEFVTENPPVSQIMMVPRVEPDGEVTLTVTLP